MFLLSRKIKGPCWLRIKSHEQTNFNVTWSQLEVNCLKYKEIVVAEENKPSPTFKILSFSTKTINNNGVNEILSIAGMMKDNYTIDEDSIIKRDNLSQNFVIMRKIDLKIVAPDYYGTYIFN